MQLYKPLFFLFYIYHIICSYILNKHNYITIVNKLPKNRSQNLIIAGAFMITTIERKKVCILYNKNININ